MAAGWSEEAGGVWGLLIGWRRPWRARPRLGNRRDPRREVRAAAALRGRWTCGWGHGVSGSEAGARDRAAGRWVQGRGRVWERGSAGCWAALGAGRARLGSGACCRGSVRRVRGERAALGRAGSGRVWGEGENGLGPRRGVGPGLLGWVWVSIFWFSSLLLLLFLFLFKLTQPNLFEFNSNTQTNKSMLQHGCNNKN